MSVLSYTPNQARDHMYETFLTIWNDPVLGWRSVVDEMGNPLECEPELFWDNGPVTDDAEVDKPSVFAYIRHYTSRTPHVGGESRRMVTRKGFVLFRVKVPAGTGLKTADGLAYIAKVAFEYKRAAGDGRGIVFKAWRPTETGIPKDSMRFNIISQVDFEYDEVS